MALNTVVTVTVTVVDTVTSLKEFEYSSTTTDTTLTETNSQRFKINDGVSDFTMLTAQLDKANFVIIIPDQDGLILKIKTSIGPTSSGIGLKASRPFLMFADENIEDIFLSNPTASPITGKLYAAGAE